MPTYEELTPEQRAAIDAHREEAQPKKSAKRAKHQGCELVLFSAHDRQNPYGGIYDPKAQKFLKDWPLVEMPKRHGQAVLCAQFGLKPPKDQNFPTGRFHFTPGATPPVTKDAHGGFVVNTWQVPEVRATAVPTAECPSTIRAVLLHVMGGCETSLAHFLNWLAVAYQFNRPTETAWIWSGTQGTGKGAIFHEVLRPLFGPSYCRQKLASELKDDFNDWLESCVLLNIDEAEFKGARAAGLDAKLRIYITGQTLSIRGMHQSAREVPNFLNVILTSNQTVVTDLPRGDRRFNVSPPQEKPVTTLFPNTDVLIAKLREEVPAFAGYLAGFAADVKRSRTAMESSAKADMIEAAATGPEEFAEALKTGNLEYFADKYSELKGMSNWPGAEELRNTVLSWLESAQHGKPAPLSPSVLCKAHNAIFGRKFEHSPDSFGKWLGRQGVRSRKNHGGFRGRAYFVSWQLPKDAEALRGDLTVEWNDGDVPPEQTAASVATGAIVAHTAHEEARGPDTDWLDIPDSAPGVQLEVPEHKHDKAVRQLHVLGLPGSAMSPGRFAIESHADMKRLRQLASDLGGTITGSIQ